MSMAKTRKGEIRMQKRGKKMSRAKRKNRK